MVVAFSPGCADCCCRKSVKICLCCPYDDCHVPGPDYTLGISWSMGVSITEGEEQESDACMEIDEDELSITVKGGGVVTVGNSYGWDQSYKINDELIEDSDPHDVEDGDVLSDFKLFNPVLCDPEIDPVECEAVSMIYGDSDPAESICPCFPLTHDAEEEVTSVDCESENDCIQHKCLCTDFCRSITLDPNIAGFYHPELGHVGVFFDAANQPACGSAGPSDTSPLNGPFEFELDDDGCTWWSECIHTTAAVTGADQYWRWRVVLTSVDVFGNIGALAELYRYAAGDSACSGSTPFAGPTLMIQYAASENCQNVGGFEQPAMILKETFVNGGPIQPPCWDIPKFVMLYCTDGGGMAPMMMAAGAQAADTGECIHKGAATGETVTCQTCRGSTKLKVFTCAIHGACTTARKVEGLACCATCVDWSA